MPVIRLVAALCLGYAAGSLNFAIIVTRLVTRQDIRLLGNGNPGTANVARSVGKGWAALVFFGDLAKGFLVMLLVRSLIFPSESWISAFAASAAGLAAITGHCRPLFFRFRGGRGAATAIGVYLFFIPAEMLLSMVAAFIIALLVFRKLEAPVARWTPMLFIFLAPLVTWMLAGRDSVVVFGAVSLGGHPWYVIVAVGAVSCFILLLNTAFFRDRVREYRRKMLDG